MPGRFDPVSLGSPKYLTREVGVFQITHARFPAGLVLAPHVHERACVATTLAGGWNSVLGRRSYECQTGTLLVEPPTARHANHFSQPTGVLVVQPDQQQSDLLLPCTRLLSAAHCFRDARVAALARRLTGELTADDDLAPLVIEGLALELLATAARGVATRVSPATAPRWVERARERLHEHSLTGTSMATIAAEAGVHPVYLARVFRACFGTSPGSYARRVRLDHAAELLATTDEPLSEIATDAGFADQSHFTREFRRHTGVPPGTFRRQTRGSRAPSGQGRI
jgi:AraC family transcriptional regulator